MRPSASNAMTTGSWINGSAATSSIRNPGASLKVLSAASGESAGAGGASTPAADCSVGPVVGPVAGRVDARRADRVVGRVVDRVVGRVAARVVARVAGPPAGRDAGPVAVAGRVSAVGAVPPVACGFAPGRA